MTYVKREFRAMPVHDDASGVVVSYTCLVCMYELGYAGRQKWPVWPTEAEAEMHIAHDHGERTH
jgi:hypothetical protein